MFTEPYLELVLNAEHIVAINIERLVTINYLSQKRFHIDV